MGVFRAGCCQGSCYSSSTNRSLASIWRAGMGVDRLDGGVAVGVQAGFHLHRLDGQQHVTGLDLLAHRDRDRGNGPRHRCADMVGVALLRLRFGGGLGLDRPVRHPDHPRLSVQLEEHLHFAVIGGFPHGLQADFQRLAGVDLGGDLVARRHAVEEGAGRQGADRAIHPVAAHVIQKDLGIHQVAVQILVIDAQTVEIF